MPVKMSNRSLALIPSTVDAVRATDEARELVLLLWGLIPSWSKDAKIG
jgi:putative SOS response-associated peptidase YedK